MPQWSPDGTELAYGVQDGNIYIESADGSGDARLFLERSGTQWPVSFSPDGHWLAITENTTERGRDILLVSRDGQIRVFTDTDANENAAAFSPDGKWIAYQSDETGRPEVYVQPFPGPGPRFPISSNGGTAPVWSRDGSELFYRQGAALVVVPVSAVPSFTAGTATILFDGPFQADGSGHPSYDVAPGGERFLMMYREREQLTQLHVVVNATAELEAGSP